MPKDLNKKNQQNDVVLNGKEPSTGDTKLKQSLKSVGFEEGSKMLAPSKGTEKLDDPKLVKPEVKPKDIEEPKKETKQEVIKPPVTQEEKERQEKGKRAGFVMNGIKAGLAYVDVERTAEARVAKFIEAFKGNGVPPGLASKASSLAKLVLAMGPLAATRGEKKAFDFSQESLQWGMERNTLETDKKWGNLKGTEKAMNRFRLFKSQLNARATGKLSRSKAERTKLKLENYKQKCIESIKGHVGPLLQEYQVFCAMILQQTGVSIVEPEIPQLMLSSLASIRVDPAVDESQVDHGGDAESGEQELQKGKEAMANDN